MIPLTDQVDALFAEWDKPDSPGCALAIIQDGEIAYRRGYGCADLEHGVPITSTSVFDIASTSKQFTAMCIAILRRQGKLSLDDEIRKHIPEMPAYGAPITIRHLIHHTSGIRDYLTLMDLAGMRYENEYPDEEVIELICRQKELNFEPGEKYLYSNTGYFLLGEIVKRASGKTLRAFAEEWIFAPLGMKKTHYHDDFTEIVKDRAMGYSSKKDGGLRIDMSIFDVVGDGCVYTTVEDLYLWDQNFYHNLVGNYGQDLIREITTPGKLNDGEEQDYAFGLTIEKYRGLDLISHSGDWAGYRSEMIRFPEQRFSVICLANFGGIEPSGLAKRIADIYLEKAFTEPAVEKREQDDVKSPDLPLAELEKLTGFYRNPKTGTIWELSMQDGKLIVEVNDTKFQLVRTSSTHFRSDEVQLDIQVDFIPPSKSEPMSIQAQIEGGNPSKFVKLETASLSRNELAEYAGEYSSDELGTPFKFVVEEENLVLERKGIPNEVLKPTMRDGFKGARLTLQFTRDEQSHLTGFRLNAEGVKNLHFTRA
jgi:CubicO group peptidase (beta-lactamase class C family)